MDVLNYSTLQEFNESIIILEATFPFNSGTLQLASLQSQFPGVTGLKYRHTNGNLRAVRIDGDGKVGFSL